MNAKCKDCGRDIETDARGDWTHLDKRVTKHPADPTEDYEMAYKPVLDPADPADASLLDAAKEAFAGDFLPFEEVPMFPELVEPEGFMDDEEATLEQTDVVSRVTRPQLSEKEEAVVGDPVADYDHENPIFPGAPSFGTPRREDMVTVRGGGLYLTARRRIVWLRGEPEPHPGWTIDTYAEEIERGKYVSNSKVEAGYARYRANVFDDTGRLIGTGTKTEWSERFMDFAEKAETGAIARALAVCGYGTEAALDLDEGLDQDRIADAPVSAQRAINVSPSNVPGLIQGGRSTNVTSAQLNEIQRLVKQSAMGIGLVPFMESVLGITVPPLGTDPTGIIMVFLQGLTFDEAGKLIMALNKVGSDAP